MAFSDQDIPARRWRQARIAGIYLFGAHVALRDDFWTGLTPESVKAAFRRQARLYHPDLQGPEAPADAAKRREWFCRIKDSYDVLLDFLRSREEAAPAAPPPCRRIIAVGGAKGGVGKSTFAANLGVFLAGQGYQTVLLDLDLGGANLHLYLGETAVKRTVNDFLEGAFPHLADLAVPTRFGPTLIGGDSSRLGSANISFPAKQRLIRAIRELEAQRLVIDLGSDTSFNILDFFLAADVRLVITTPEPAAYLEAYNLIKVGLWRALNRMFSQAPPALRQDYALKELIHQATRTGNGDGVRTIEQLRERLRQRHPAALPWVQGILETYRPRLLLNKSEDDDQAGRIVRRIQEVARKMLSLEVPYLGALPLSQDIARSARDLVPAVARDPQSHLSRHLAHLSRQF